MKRKFKGTTNESAFLSDATQKRRYWPGLVCGTGPLVLNCEMARRQGWSQAAIERTLKKLGTIARREAAIAHRKGIVPGCPCVVCFDLVHMGR